MRLPSFEPLMTLLLLAALCACGGPKQTSSGRGEAQTAQPGPPRPVDSEESEQEEDARLNRAMEAALAAAVAGDWRELRMECECGTEEGWTAVEVFGNGVGIWKNSSQFELDRAQLQSILRDFQQLGFASMAKSYGGRKEPDEDFALRVTCSLLLTIDGVRKQVVQFEKGEQWPPVRELAGRVFEACRQPAGAGITAASLDSALEKLAAGQLAVETFELTLNRKPEADALRAGVAGWLLQVDGGVATLRTYAPEGFGPQYVLKLRADEVSQVAAVLAEQKVEELPINLYDEHYTDLNLRVLGGKKNVQARQFARMTRATHGEKQARYEACFERLSQLAEKVRSEGQPSVD